MESVFVEGEGEEEEEVVAVVVVKAEVFGVVVDLGILKVSREVIFRSWITEAVCDGGGGCGGCGGARGTSTGAMGGDGGGFGVWAGVDSGE